MVSGIPKRIKRGLSPAVNYREPPNLSALWFLHRLSKRCRHQFADSPNVIRDADLHSRRDAQGLMDAAKIVVSDVQRHRRAMVQIVLAEAGREPREPTLLHPKRQVLPFDIGRADA